MCIRDSHKGAPPKAPAGQSAWRHRAHFGTRLTRFVAPLGSSAKDPCGTVRMAPPRPCRQLPHTP
eukprot:1229971-Pyramimonas_sp.AAC.1